MRWASVTGPHRAPPDPPAPDSPEVLVVGGGPAGSTTAGLLARTGRSVLVVDRASFPRPKACGECLSPGAVAALERLGLLDAVLALEPARLPGWTVAGSHRSARADFGRGLEGLGVPRERLDTALLEAALDRGAHLREEVRVETVAPAEPGVRPAVRLRLPSGERAVLRPRVVVGADGLRSRVVRSLGLLAGRRGGGRASLTCRVRWPEGSRGPGRGSLRVHQGVTLGMAPVRADGKLGNVTVVADAARHRSELAGDARGFVEEILRERVDGPLPEIVDGPWASGPFRQPVPRPWAPGVVLVGDAAGYYDPFTGQGIYRALRSGELAAGAVSAALEAGAGRSWAALERYGNRWQREVRPRRRVQRVVDAVMSRPWLREGALDLVARGGLLPAIIRVTGDAAPVSSLFDPRQWAGPRE